MRKPVVRFPRVNRVKGGFVASGRRFGIVVSEFNEPLTNALLDGALDTLVRHGAREKDIHVVYVPGAFEIPLAAARLIARRRPDAVITLAVVIKGQTRHFDQVVTESAKGVRELADRSGVPVILGIVAADDARHAFERTGVKHANKGREWALAAIEMAGVTAALDDKRGRP